MKQTMVTKKMVWLVGAWLLLLTGFVVCRYFLFDLHGMKDWPFALFVFGMGVVLLQVVFNAKKAAVFSGAGYSVSFVIGILFNSDGVDAGGGATNNLWKVWTVSFLVIIVSGIAWDRLVNKK